MTVRYTLAEYTALGHSDETLQVTRQQPERNLVWTPIKYALKLYAWTWYHAHLPLYDEPGFVDVVAYRWHAGELYMVCAELKNTGKKPTKDQREWLDTWAHLFVEHPLTCFSCMWYPENVEAVQAWLGKPWAQNRRPPGIWGG